MMMKRWALAAVLTCAGLSVALAQPFEAGPPGTVVGSSMSGQPIGPARAPLSPRIGNAEVFGDTVEERRWGRPFDRSHLNPQVRRRVEDVPIELRAREGQSRLDPGRAGAFARSGPTAIGGSSVTRPSLGGGIVVPGNGGR